MTAWATDCLTLWYGTPDHKLRKSRKFGESGEGQRKNQGASRLATNQICFYAI